MRQYMLKRYHERKDKIIELLGGKCHVCGATGKLDVHHTSGKKFTINGTDWSKASANGEDLKKELETRKLLCQDCHTLETLKNRGFKLAKNTHGTLSSYRYCKCELCKAAEAEYMRKYRRNKVAPVAQLVEQRS